MLKKEEYGSIIEMCPVRNVVARFGNKWSLLTVLVIGKENVVRFNELRRLIPDVSSRVLSATLRERRGYAEVPPRVEYRLTDSGRSLLPIIHQLTDWALANMPRVLAHRRAYESNIQLSQAEAEV